MHRKLLFMEDHTPDQQNPTQTHSTENNQGPAIKWGWLRALIFVPVFIFFAILTSLVTPLLRGLEKDASNLASYAILVGSCFAAIYCCRKWIDRESLEGLGMGFRPLDMLKGFLFGTFLVAVGAAVLQMAGWASFSLQTFDGLKIFYAFVLMFLVGVFEEWLSRTYVQHNLGKSVHPYLALVITSAVFAALHLGNQGTTWFSTLEIFLAGVMLGLWYVHHGNISFPIGLHFGWNFVQGYVFGFEVSGHAPESSFLKQTDLAEPLLSGGIFGLEGSAVGLLVTLAACLALFVYTKPKPLA